MVTDTVKFIHQIDQTSYDEFLQKEGNILIIYIPGTNSLQPTLKYEIDLLETLKNYTPKRQSRSIGALGKIWKIIAGSPDHDDVEYINKTLDELTDNNNKQVIINTDFSNQINKITKLINTLMELDSIRKDNFILKEDIEILTNKIRLAKEAIINIKYAMSIRKDNFILKEDIEILTNKIRLAKEAIINIKYAIQWAKYNIIKSYLLNKKEKNTPFNNIENALELSKISILSNNTNILYIIKMPITSEI